MAHDQVNELKKQMEQIHQQGDSMVLEDVASDQGDVTYRMAYTAIATSDNKQKEKIRQIERQRKEANDVSFFYPVAVIFLIIVRLTVVTHAGFGRAFSCDCLSVCIVHTLKGKRLELLAPKSVDI